MHHQITLELSAEKAFEYQKAILAVLAKVEIGECEAIYKEHIKTVYELLGRLNSTEFKISKQEGESSKLEHAASNLEHQTSNLERLSARNEVKEDPTSKDEHKTS